MYNSYQWVEDDACLSDPDHETADKAWLRIFGESNFREQWDSVKHTEEDGGDSFTRIMPNGIRVTHSYDGYYIHKKGK